MKKNLITKDMIVADVVSMFPEAADIITSYGLHCVGCHINAYETLEQGLLGHGYSEEDLKNMLHELNEYLEESLHEEVSKISTKTEKMKIEVSKKAIKKIEETAKIQKKKSIVRLEARRVEGVVKYSLNFIDDREIQKRDKVFSFAQKKVQIVADKRNHKKMSEVFIDYVQEGDREGFKIMSKK